MGDDPIGKLLVPPGGVAIARQRIQRGNPSESVQGVALRHAVVFDPRGPLDVVACAADRPVVVGQRGQEVGRPINGRQLFEQPPAVSGISIDGVGVLDVRRAGQRTQRIPRHPMAIQAAVGVHPRWVGGPLMNLPAIAGRIAMGNSPPGR